MAVTLTLHVITASDVASHPTLNAMEHTPLPEWFARATENKLQLKIREHKSQHSSQRIDGGGLQEMFREFVDSPPTAQLVHDIALLFCRSWIVGDLQGLMFDYNGKDLLTSAHVRFDGVPRQACAVFLDAMSDWNEADQLFVAVHELGHVFNLLHDTTKESFMAEDTVDAPRHFSAKDCAALTAAAAKKEPEQGIHMPGGRQFLGTPAFAARSGQLRRASERQMTKLSVALGQETFLLGEPVVLEVSLTLGDDLALSAGGLDPGFEGFQVWFTNPLGERRLHLHQRHYCQMRRRRRGRHPHGLLTNNPRIHLGQNGLNFVLPGKYTVWAEVELRDRHAGRVLVASDPVAFTLRHPRDDQERELSGALCDPQIAFFVANKSGPLRRRQERMLRHIASRHAGTTVDHLRYALGHCALRSGKRRTASAMLQGLDFQLPSMKEGVERLRSSL